MLRTLITGCKGQLGNEIRRLSVEFPLYDFILTDIEELDITNPSSVEKFFSKNKPSVLINCAAYNGVDKAETEPEPAYLINSKAVGYLTRACMKHDCYPVHISTDYVFDGGKNKPYNESDEPDPLSVYGKSKLAGEMVFKTIGREGIIIRTSWLYSSFGHNFVKTILRKASEVETLRVVNDQVGSPTYARDLAKVILEIIPVSVEKKDREIYHYANDGACSWYSLASATIKLSGLTCEVVPISTSAYPLPAPRPFYSVLDINKIKKRFNIAVPHWEESLKACINEINS